MNLEKLKPYFIYTRSQRSGLFALSMLIVALQLAYHFRNVAVADDDSAEKQHWLSLQPTIDSLGKAKTERPKFYPFNPNFISDFKGYRLGMSVAEIDRLLEFRKTNRYVNSAKEFQAVTKVSDSLLRQIAPYFKFPDWVKNKGKTTGHWQADRKKQAPKALIDINLATQEELKKVYGIGDGLSERILKEKEKLGGFVSMEQMKDIWGLSEEVIANLERGFKVAEMPNVKKIKINDASVKELSQFPYFRYALAKSIVTYRSMNGDLKDAADLLKISGFPVDKVKIIALYLEF